MPPYVKQHIIPKTYLKQFSDELDGKNICVIDINDQYKDTVQVKNSGDKIFWVKNVYDDHLSKDKKIIEKFLGTEIEPFYNEILEEIKKEETISDWKVKYKLLKFIFSTLNRSLEWRNRSYNKNQFKNKMINIINNGKVNETPSDLDEIAKEDHLKRFVDEETVEKILKDWVEFAMVHRWSILKIAKGYSWLTTDNPGFKMNNDEGKTTINFDDNFKNCDSFFFPFTKEYAIYVHRYFQGDPPTLNFKNTDIDFIDPTQVGISQFNRFTYATMNRLLVSTNREQLKFLAHDINLVQYD